MLCLGNIHDSHFYDIYAYLLIFMLNLWEISYLLDSIFRLVTEVFWILLVTNTSFSLVSWILSWSSNFTVLLKDHKYYLFEDIEDAAFGLWKIHVSKFSKWSFQQACHPFSLAIYVVLGLYLFEQWKHKFLCICLLSLEHLKLCI